MADEEILTRRRVLRDEDADVIEEPAATAPMFSRIAQVVYFVAGIIEAVLALRFVLQLLGANRGSAFVDFVYDITTPLVTPFFGMFGSTPTFGAARFEAESLVAIVVYALVAYLIVGLLRVLR